MPQTKIRLSQSELRAYRSNASRLERLGVPLGDERDFRSKPVSDENRNLRITQQDALLATIHALPWNGSAVVLYANVLSRAGGILITHCELTLPWDPRPLELDEPEGMLYFNDFVREPVGARAPILNRRLTGGSRLGRGQWNGMIVGRSCDLIPPSYIDGSVVPVELSISDEWGEEFRFAFEASVSYAVKKICEPRERRSRLPYVSRQPLVFGNLKEASDPPATTHLEAANSATRGPRNQGRTSSNTGKVRRRSEFEDHARASAASAQQ